MRIASGTTEVGDCAGRGVDTEVDKGVAVPSTVPDPHALNRVAIIKTRKKNFARTSLLHIEDYPNYTLRPSSLKANIPPV